MDGLEDPEIQKSVRMEDLKDLIFGLLYVLKIEATTQASHRDRHSILGARVTGDTRVQHWFSRNGVPLELLSDQGRNFDSAACKRLSKVLGINEIRTTALHPQSDGMVERCNWTNLNNLSLLVSSNQQDSDKKQPLLLLVYRSTAHETTGYFPSQMLFGCDLR
ncbi:retrovirus-related Pol polyprotein from transposon 412 [Trichonephila clavipes]|nr:retrovirus-related Pol polyprotein from transposon 412 [Trichonephila clavipes]